MKAVIYARFSSDHQNEQSIDAQVRACREYAEKHELTVIQVYADQAISGRESSTALRAEYQKMRQDAKKQLFEVILIHKYDRVARSLREQLNLEATLEKEGVRLIAVAQDFGIGPEAKIMKAIMGSMAEFYSDNLAGEVRKGLRENALKALHNGGVAPFGYDVVDRQYVINDLEAGYVRKMFDCALNRQGFRDLIAEMKEAGITGKRGRELKYTQIYEILHNEKYCGVYLYSVDEEKDRTQRRSKPNAIRIEDAFPAIIDKATFEEVQKIMAARKQTGRHAEYLCSGLVYCAKCGGKMHVNKSERKGHTYLRYACHNKCGASTVPLEDVDTAAKMYIRELLSEDTRTKVAKAIQAYDGYEKDRVDAFNDAVSKTIKEKEASYNNLLTNLSSGVLAPEIIADISERMSRLKNEIAELKEAKPPVNYTVDTIQLWLQNIRTVPDAKAVHILIERIDAMKTKDNTDLNITSTLKPVLEKLVAGEGFEPPTSGL